MTEKLLYMHRNPYTRGLIQELMGGPGQVVIIGGQAQPGLWR